MVMSEAKHTSGPSVFSIDWTRYKLRTCRSLHSCAICKHFSDGDTSIRFGDPYYDGGYGRRAHQLCVNRLSEGR